MNEPSGIGRLAFLGLFVLILFLTIIAGVFLQLIAPHSRAGIIVLELVWVIALIPVFALRLKNIGYQRWGWMTFLAYLPVVGLIIFLVCLLKRPDSATAQPTL
jgi:hypothetical protein